MKFIELMDTQGVRFLFDIQSGWRIYDKGDDPAYWYNNRECCTLDCSCTYSRIRRQLIDEN